MSHVMVDLDHNFAEREDVRVKLIAAEAEALFVLHVNRGEIVSRGKMATGLWGITKLWPEKWDECIKACIYRLRKKIEPLGGAIENVKGSGYRLTWEDWSCDDDEKVIKLKRWSQADIAKVAAMRADGMSCSAIAKQLGVTAYAVDGIVERHLPKDMGCGLKGSDSLWSDESVNTLKSMWADGYSASAIARHIGGITRNAVIGKIDRLGLEQRKTTETARQNQRLISRRAS